jgi:hypothetical protein
MVQSIDEYIKNVLITENPVKSLLEHRGDVPYLDTVFDPISTSIRIFIVDDHMAPDSALRLVMVEEFGSNDLVETRLLNCIARINMIKNIKDENPQKELAK